MLISIFILERPFASLIQVPVVILFLLLFQNTQIFNFLISSRSHFTEKDDSDKKQLRISLSRQFWIQELSHWFREMFDLLALQELHTFVIPDYQGFFSQVSK